jgi:hypothetical protein
VSTTTAAQVDVRGPRFVAWITTAVLIVTLTASAVDRRAAAAILGVQAVFFAIGAIAGPKRHPYGILFAGLVAPRLGPVRDREPVPPLKFAQLVGLVFALVGIAGFVAGALYVGVVATGAALVAALLNAAFGICLGCQIYPLVVRLRPAPKAAETA